MNLQCLEIANQCNQVAASLTGTAAFMRSIGDNAAMSEYMHKAMDWTNHADLMMREAFESETNHA